MQGLSAMLRLLRQVGFRQLQHAWARTGLVIAGVATGVSLIVAINVANESVFANFKRTIEMLAGPAQLSVTLGGGEVGFPEAILDGVRSQAGVATAIGFVRGAFAVADGSGETLQVFGADLTSREDLNRYHIFLATDEGDVLEWLNDPSAIALTTTFAAKRGIEVGGTVRLDAPSGLRDFRVRGLLRPEGLARSFGDALVVMDLPAAQMALGRQGLLDQIDIVLNADAQLDATRDRLKDALPPTLSVERPIHRAVLYENVVSSFQAMLTGLSLLCLVAGAYVIYNTTSTGAVHRALAVASLRLVGADSRRLFAMMMLEALLLGGVGTCVGLPAGYWLAHILTGMVTDSMGVIFQLRFPVSEFTMDHRSLLAIAAVGIGTTLFASYFAARRITRLEPLEVMRADLASLVAAPRLGALTVIWVVLVLISGMALVLEVRLKSVAWGNFGSTLWFSSSIVIAIPLVSASARLLSRVLSGLFRAEGRVAAESLFRSATRTGVTVAAVALVLTIAIMFASLARSHRESVRNWVHDFFFAGDLAVSAAETDGGWLARPVPAQMAHELMSVPGVRSIETVRILPGVIFQGDRIAVVALSDGFFEPRRFSPGWYREGDAEHAAGPLRSGEGVVVSANFADHFGVHVGDRVPIDSPTGTLEPLVVGVIADYISDRGGVYMSRRLFAERWQDTMLNRVDVALEPGASLEAVRREINTRFGSRYRLSVQSPAEWIDYIGEKIDSAYAFSVAIQLLIVVVTAAGIFDLLLASIWERRRELALWRVIGADEKSVWRTVVIEATTIGGLGAALGVVVGVVTTWIWVEINYLYLLGYHLEYHFALAATLRMVGLVMVLTALAGGLAARQATRESVLAAIQSQ